MKVFAHAFAMCQSMFCAIPSLWNGWDEKAAKKMLLFLPLVGLEIGLIWWGIAWLCRRLQIPMLIAGMALCAYPYLVTGFIHLDGFMDVTDAVKSWRSLERRREILKDSCVGSFSVIGCVLLILAQFACFASLKETADIRVLILIPVVSRSVSALAVAALPPMETSQYAARERNAVSVCVPVFSLLLSLAAGFVFFGKYGFALVGGAFGYGLALLRGYRSLEGMNGDIAGFSLSFSELAAAAVLALL